ncbi:MAG TPA: hypothetical protein VFJ94_09290 [Intrasporangium sp.]|uniref:hypothetical protein n=1 Tax=Intrasporangium sp. TaxID=1925024 RepID=UPI002D79475F|nr:hypothetical protein [Intrasporangium sp.]HET7398701.1 hypothetical protein [Intrasporangium sp.]
MGQVLALLPASGGVGATLLTAATAVRAAAASRSVAAVDLDAWGAGLDVTFGLEQAPGWRWNALQEVSGVVDGAALAGRLPQAQGVRVLSMPRPWRPTGASWQGAVADVLLGLRAAHELVVVDVPRDELTVSGLAGVADAVVVVVGTRVAQLAAAAAVVPRLQSIGPETWVVLRGGDADLEELVTDELDVPVLGRLRDDARAAADVDDGVPAGTRGRGPVVDIADRILLRLLDRLAGAPPAAGVASREAAAPRRPA